MKKSIITIFLLFPFFLHAQCTIKGHVVDEKKEPMINAPVQVFLGGIVKGGVITDYDGNYVIKPLDAGYYDIVVLYQGYDSVIQKNVLITTDSPTVFNCEMKRRSSTLQYYHPGNCGKSMLVDQKPKEITSKKK